jgi:predicted nuclease of predicted toxin-antitoxin system
VTTRLLLDEMFHPRIAEELRARGHDCLAVVADADLRRSSDEDLLQRAAGDGRALVTSRFESSPTATVACPACRIDLGSG